VLPDENFLRESSKIAISLNVSVVKKANVYFDGRVTSRTVLFADGTKKHLAS